MYNILIRIKNVKTKCIIINISGANYRQVKEKRN